MVLEVRLAQLREPLVHEVLFQRERDIHRLIRRDLRRCQPPRYEESAWAQHMRARWVWPLCQPSRASEGWVRIHQGVATSAWHPYLTAHGRISPG